MTSVLSTVAAGFDYRVVTIVFRQIGKLTATYHVEQAERFEGEAA